MVLEIILGVIVIASGAYLWYFISQTRILNRELHEQVNKYDRLEQQFKNLEEQFNKNLLTDPLTGLPSQKIFEDHLGFTMSQSARHQLIFSVMYLDLHGYKMINDVLGYDIGDEILREVSQRLQNCVRQVDTLSRLNGDKFVIIYSQIAKAERAAYLAQRLLDVFALPFHVQGQEFYISANIGVAVFPTDGRDGRALVNNAELALSQAKMHGRNTFQFYQKEMHDTSHRELVLGASLHNEASYQQLTVYYQPRMNLKMQKIACMEAILQWHHPDYGLIAFEEFSRIAENNNIVAVYEWLMRSACQDLVKWRKHGFNIEAVSVQVTLKQLESPHFIEKSTAILRECGLEPSSLILEMTESSLLTRIDLVEKMLHMLKRLGVQIAINNFGVGHLQLRHLRRLPIDIFKIDQALVFDIDTNSESEAIVNMIIALASNLKADVIADGVENERQKNLLLSLGCHMMQGSLFSSPFLAGDFDEKVLENIRVRTLV